MKASNFTIALLVFFTLIKSASAQLSGIYTVGGTTPDYATVQDAATAAQTGGVSGPVIFNIRPGTYTGKVDIATVAGTSATNTVTFQSENGDSTSVIITDSASATGSNFTFHVFGTDYLIVKNVTISRPGTNANSTVISIGSNSRYLQVRNCIIESNVITGTTLPSAQVSMPLGSPNDSSITFENNIFRGGSIGLYVQGQGVASPIPLMQILNNQFINQSSRGMQLTYLVACDIRGNNITTTGTGTAYRGVILRRVTGKFSVSANEIFGSNGNPLHFDTCGGSLGNAALVTNNFLHAKGTAAVRGIYVQNCSYLNIYHNSVNITSTSVTGAALFINDAGLSNNLNIKNNILVNNGLGIAFRAGGSGSLASFASCNFNDIFVSSGVANLVTRDTSNYTTLAAWQNATNLDTNSVSIDPEYFTATDLHTSSSGVNDLASFIATVPNDIDGQLRSITTPDIGADEFTPLLDNVGLLGVYLPTVGDCGDSSTSVAFIIRNFGLSTQTGFSVSADVTGAVTQNLTQVYAGSLLTNQVDTIVFTQTLNTYSGGTFTITAYSQLAGDQYLLNDTVADSFTVNGHPNAPLVVSPQQHCSNFLQVTATPDPGDVLMWYDQPVGGNLLYIGDLFNPPVTSDTVFYVETRKASPTAGCIRFTEIQTRPTNFIEIQNLSGAGFDATGWIVAASLNNTNINAVNGNIWTLGYMNAGEVRFKTDLNTDTNYWGSNLAFSATGRSWVIILDPNGNIADFVAWNYPADSLPNMNATIGVFSNITIGSEWIGNGFTGCVSTTVSNHRIGNYDNNDSTDWVCDTVTKGVHNPGLAPVFTECGIGQCASTRIPVVVTLIPGISVNLGNDTMIGLPFSITLDAGPGIPSYLWSTGATTQTIVVTTHGTYWVTVVDSSGSCSFADTINILLNVGMNDPISDNEISIFPNPANDKLVIRGQESLLNDASIHITDIEGRLVEMKKVTRSEEESILDLANLNEGIYFLQVISGNRSYSKRFTIIR